MKKSSKYYPPSVLLIILSTISSVIWVAYSLYDTYSQDSDPVVSEELLTPINPSLNTQQFEQIRSSIFLNEDEIDDTLVLTPYEPLESPEEATQSLELDLQDFAIEENI